MSGEYKIIVKDEKQGDGAKRTADDLKQVGAAAKEAGEHADQFGAKFERRLIGLLGKAGLGGLGELVHLAFSPILLIGAGVVQVFEQLKKTLEDVHEQNKKLIEDSDEAAEAQEKLGETVRDISLDAITRQEEHLKHLSDGYDALARSMAVATNAARDNATATNAIADAILAEAIAKIHLSEAEGITAPGVAEAKIAKLKLEAEIRKQNAANTAAQAQIDRDADAAKKAGQIVKDKRWEAEKKGADVVEVDQAMANAQTELDKQRKAHAQAEQEAEEKEALAKDYQWFYQGNAAERAGKLPAFGAFMAAHLSLINRDVDDVTTDATRARARADALDPTAMAAHIADLKRDRDSKERDADAAARAADKAQEDQRKYTEAKQDEEAKLTADKTQQAGENRAAEGAINDNRRAAEMQPGGTYPTTGLGRNLRRTGEGQADIDMNEADQLRALIAKGYDPNGRMTGALSYLLADMARILKDHQLTAEMTAREIEDLRSQLNSRP